MSLAPILQEHDDAERFRGLIDSVDGIVWEARPDFTFTFVSRQAERLLGYPAGRWIREPGFWYKILHPQDRERAVRFCQEQTARLSPHAFEYRMIAADGRVVWIRDIVSVEARDGLPVKLSGIMVDITPLREAEARLQRSEERFRGIVEASEEGIWLLDEHEETVFVNSKMASILGYQAEEMLGKSPLEFMDDHQKKKTECTLRERRQGLRARTEVRLRRKDGRKVWVSSASNPVFGKDGQFAGILAMVGDIQDKRRHEILLGAQRDIFEFLVEGKGLDEALDCLAKAVELLEDDVVVGILLLTEGGARFRVAAGPSLPEKIKRSIEHGDAGPTAGSSGPAIWRRELVITEDLAADPNWAPYAWIVEQLGLRSCWANPIIARNGTALGSFAMYLKEKRVPNASDLQLIHDATSAAALIIEHVFLRDSLTSTVVRLRESEERFRCMADASVDGMVVHDQGKILIANQGQANMFGYEVGELEKMSLLDITALESRSTLRENMVGPSKPPYVITCLRKDGSTFLGEVRSRDSFYEGRPVRVSTLQDVTERRRWEEQRERALDQERKAKEEAERNIRLRDDFLAVASHELKTPLTPLRLDLQLQRRYLREAGLPASPKTDLLFRAIEHADKEFQRLSNLVDDLLDVSRISAGRMTLNKTPFDLSALVNEALERFAAQWEKAHCTLETSIEPGVTGLWDRDRIDQVVTNLLSNALKYGEGTPVTIELKRVGARARLVVRDHGIGFAPKNREVIFDRFVRAAPLDHGGLGLGLYIAREIVRAHGGAITAAGEMGEGAEFIVELPLASSGD